jgi:hypothetical protein
LMLWKNYSLLSLRWIWPVRILLETMALGKALVSGNLEWAKAIVQANLWMISNPQIVWRKHRKTQNLRKLDDNEIRKKMYSHSIAVRYYFLGKHTATEL